MNGLLGLPLDVALVKLEAAGIAPVAVMRSQAPRRPLQAGTWRVVRVREGGRALVACAFLDELQPDAENSTQEVRHGALETQA